MKSNKIRKSAGTTLIEILVVIVVFTVGILAVVQIFPRGFQVLAMNRAAAMATFQARDIMGQLNAHPDMLPDGIVPVGADSLLPDRNFVSTNLGFEGLSIASNGVATLPDGNSTDIFGNPLNWETITGFNNVRGIIGENQPIPAAKLVAGNAGNTMYYGGLVVLQFGPTAIPAGAQPSSTSLVIYGNDFTRNLGTPVLNSTVDDFQFYFNYAPYDNPPVMQVLLPTAAFPRTYQLSFSGYVQQTAPSNSLKRTYTCQIAVPATDTNTLAGMVTVPLNTLPVVGTDVLTSVDYQSIRVEPIFNELAINTPWSHNPFEVKILNPTLGTFLFSPYAYNYWITRPSGPREALHAKFNYVVRDWRILHEDFRIDGSTPSTHQLPIQSLRTASQPNVDGTAGPGGSNGFGFENLASDTNGVDHFILLDLQTGGTFVENLNGQNLITVDKNRGIITFNSVANANNVLMGELLYPDGTQVAVPLADRPVRVLYQARYEWAVQVLKAASSYTVSALAPGVGQYYVGGSSILGGGLTRIYFPLCDSGRKVVVGQMWYEEAGDTQPRSLTSQDFVIHPAGTNGDFMKMPYIDVTDVDPAAQTLDENTYGYAARDVKGSSLVVRVVWNPNTFTLTNTASSTQTAGQLNVQAETTWGQSWRTATTETFLDQGVTSR